MFYFSSWELGKWSKFMSIFLRWVVQPPTREDGCIQRQRQVNDWTAIGFIIDDYMPGNSAKTWPFWDGDGYPWPFEQWWNISDQPNVWGWKGQGWVITWWGKLLFNPGNEVANHKLLEFWWRETQPKKLHELALPVFRGSGFETEYSTKKICIEKSTSRCLFGKS